MIYKLARAEFEREYWQGLLRATNGNVSAASRLAGMWRTAAHKILRRYNVKNPVRRPHWCGNARKPPMRRDTLFP